MPASFSHHSVLPGAPAESSREGRDCEWSWRMTVLLLFPRLNARPGPWAVLLAVVCAFLLVRILESGGF